MTLVCGIIIGFIIVFFVCGALSACDSRIEKRHYEGDVK